jgi:uncharacterized damage-inducible protein DinB
MSDIGQAFIARSRYHLAEDFLPKIEHCLEKLSDEQIWWRANEQSNSIGNLVLHLCGNARQWIVCGVGDGADARDRDAEFAQREIVPRDELLSLLRRTISDVDSTLARYEPERLLETRTIQSTEGSALDAILHVVEHFAMHAGQIFLLTKVLAKEELAFYDFSTGEPVRKWRRSQQ